MIEEGSEVFNGPDQRTMGGDDIVFEVGDRVIYVNTHLDQEVTWRDPIVAILVSLSCVLAVQQGALCLITVGGLGFLLFLLIHHTHMHKKRPKRTVGEALAAWSEHVNDKGEVFEQCFVCNGYGFFSAREIDGCRYYKCSKCGEEYRVKV